MSTGIRAVAKNEVVLKDAGTQKTKSGLDIPNLSEKAKPEIGIVVEIGPGTKPMPFEIGDKVVYRKYMDNKITILTTTFNVVDFKDLLLVLDDENSSK